MRLTNDDGEMNLAGTVSFASSQIGQYGAVVIIDGVHWTNESVRENDHLLDGPVIVNSHADVESVAMIVGGLSGVALSCGKAKEESDASIFGCIPHGEYLVKEANWRLVHKGGRSEVSQPTETAGSTAIESAAGLSCDSVLKNQLVFQRAASGMDRMNAVVTQIQAQRAECGPTFWGPVIVDADLPTVVGVVTDLNGEKVVQIETNGCAGSAASVGFDLVGGIDVPVGLEVGGKGAAGRGVRSNSGRDSDNNLIVHFSHNACPDDGARCWLYSSRLREWGQESY